MKTPPPTDRARVRRSADLADYDQATVHAILDDAYICQVAFHDGQNTHSIPMTFWRIGDYVYIHGSNGGRLMRTLLGGAQACVSVTHVDGLVLARSAFNHSMNYRSVMVYGQFERVDDGAPALDAFMDKLAPGRKHAARGGNAKELAATTVLRMPLFEAACKVRTGGPIDDAEDMDIPVWTGVLPMLRTRSAPVADDPNFAVPDYVRDWAD